MPRHALSRIALGLALLLAGPAGAQAAAPGRHAAAPQAAEAPLLVQGPTIDLNLRWAGSWLWTRNGRSDNVSTFEILRDNTASYCYDRRCSRVTYSNANGTLTFSNNGTDHFELQAAEGGNVLVGRYWGRRADRQAAPNAIIRMVKPPR
ncbi:hypothetical protein [Falsiroseomonas selenitidurans]|uniref:Protease inhibitor Inh n=1 Tax=Falsiroseomonas selenitidurans TaxID=2716335 RepID=A0ABX1E286_9PROT|nr:hypothetical protein [Falsiroseomonas selenitidurans]NKC31276.1 hypothetical protein [Falsiroseomonas selenitidurans]